MQKHVPTKLLCLWWLFSRLNCFVLNRERWQSPVKLCAPLPRNALCSLSCPLGCLRRYCSGKGEIWLTAKSVAYSVINTGVTIYRWWKVLLQMLYLWISLDDPCFTIQGLKMIKSTTKLKGATSLDNEETHDGMYWNVHHKLVLCLGM